MEYRRDPPFRARESHGTCQRSHPGDRWLEMSAADNYGRDIKGIVPPDDPPDHGVHPAEQLRRLLQPRRDDAGPGWTASTCPRCPRPAEPYWPGTTLAVSAKWQ